jgi:DNA transformation protein and related proteins
MAKAPDPVAEFICDQLRDWVPVAARRLFGGWGIYNGPIMFGLISRDTIYFRTDDGNRQDFAAAGMKPFRYTMPNGKAMEMAFSEVPADILEDTKTLAQWAAKAHAAALKVARGKAAKTKPAKPPARPAARPRPKKNAAMPRRG